MPSFIRKNRLEKMAAFVFMFTLILYLLPSALLKDDLLYPTFCADGKDADCGEIRCKSQVFSRSDNFPDALFWIWRTILFISSLLIISTFCIDPLKFRHPTRPFVFIAMCLNITSMVYFVHAYYGCDEIMCSRSHLLKDRSSNTTCPVIFIMLYFSVLAAAIWWVILAVCYILMKSLPCNCGMIRKLSSAMRSSRWIDC